MICKSNLVSKFGGSILKFDMILINNSKEYK